MRLREVARPIHRLMVAAAVIGAPCGLTAQETKGSTESTATAARRAAEARVQVGDRIVLHVLREPDLTQTVTVNERGDAEFVKIGTLKLTSTSIGGMHDTLRLRYSQFLRSPSIDVAVLRRVIVHGDVRAPNVYFVDVATTLRDVISMAGGMLETANSKNIAIMRAGKRIPVPNWEGDQTLASDLISGDEVVVGRQNWFVLNALSATSVATLVASVALTILRR